MKSALTALLAALLLGPVGAGPGSAQTATVAVDEENFRARPQGAIVAELFRGTTLRAGELRDRWRAATLEAWIWARSVQEEGQWVVVNAGGENLRATPNGERVGRALGGARLDPVERSDNWLRVRRSGWIWRPSIEVEEAPEPEGSPVAASAEPSSSREFVSAPAGLVVLDQPGGDSVARLGRGATVEVLARDGDWTRVRLEGWTFRGALGADDAAARVLADLPGDSLRQHPERYRGRLVEWTVQFIALQEAERIRTDFLEGEPFMLTRGPGEETGFVYLAIPPERMEEVGELAPLQRIRVLGRVRTARSALTEAPVLDLLEIIR